MVETPTLAGRQVVFLAGGRATRLRGHDNDRPKVLQSIAGTLLLDRLLASASRLGFDRFHFALDHRFEPIVDHLARRATDFTWSLDDVPGGAGTAGAVRSAQRFLEEQFVVWLADTLAPTRLPVDFLPPPSLGCLARMCVSASVPDVRPNVMAQDGRIKAYRKDGCKGCSFVDAGLYALSKDVVDLIPTAGRFDLEDLWPLLIEKDQLQVAMVLGTFLDIGTPERMALAEQHLSKGT